MKTFFGGIFIEKTKLQEQGIKYPIKLEYYKMIEKDENLKGEEVTYGIEIVKTEYKIKEVKIEKEKIEYFTKDEKEVNEFLKILKENEVTPISLRDIMRDVFFSKKQNFVEKLAK